MRALVILFLVPGFSLGLAAGATNIVGDPRPVPVQATNLIWSGRVFTTKKDFAAWLAWRGSSYQLWATRHPAAARHFPHPSLRSLETGSWVQFEGAGSSAAPDVRSTRALLIATISSALVLAMLILVSIVRSARFLLDPPRIRNRLRVSRPPSAVLAAAVASAPQGRARAPDRTRASLAASSESRVGAVRLDRRERWSRLRRLERSTAEWVAWVAAPNSRLMRHYLPKVTFYAVAVVLSFAIGAWVAIYLQ
jgi:hypothetical protein